MPVVDGKHFSYDARGRAAAAKARAKAKASKPEAAGPRSAPSSKANPTAASRSHGQRGAAMKAEHAAPRPPRATTPAMPARPTTPTRRILPVGEPRLVRSAPMIAADSSRRPQPARPTRAGTARRAR